MKRRYDALVVGGGHNGLVAAHYLAQAGLAVAVLERRDGVGGMCAAVEFFPGYVGTMTNSPGSFEPKIAHDMRLAAFGLEWVNPDPTLVQPFEDGRAFVAWRDRERVREVIAGFSPRDVDGYQSLVDRLEAFARRLGVSLFEPPPGLQDLAARLRTPEDEADFAAVAFGSVRDLLDEHLESEQMKAVVAMLATIVGNTGPSTPGSPLVLMHRPLSLASMSVDADDDPRKQPLRGSTGLPIGSMAGLAAAMRRSLEASGVTIHTDCEVVEIKVGPDGSAQGVVLADGTEMDASIVLSNVNPKTTLLRLTDAAHTPAPLRARLERLKMRGGAFKLALALDGVPDFACAAPGERDAFASCQFRIAPSMDYLDRAFDDHRYGRPSEEPLMWGLVPSMTSPGLAPAGKHLMSVNVWYAPYHLAEGTWAGQREAFGARCIEVLSRFIPNLPAILTDVRCFSPADLEAEFGLLEGHQLHGDMTIGGWFGLRPVAGLSDYRTPIRGLYLCGAGTWPGGFVSGIPGHNASHQSLADFASPGHAPTSRSR